MVGAGEPKYTAVSSLNIYKPPDDYIQTCINRLGGCYNSKNVPGNIKNIREKMGSVFTQFLNGDNF
jgi:hypothetical protein